MARGKTKLKKGQRMAVGRTLLDFHYDEKIEEQIAAMALNHWNIGDEECNHRELDLTSMEQVGKLLLELFITSFTLALPSLFQGMLQNIQDHVLKEKLLGFLDAGFRPTLIKNMAKDKSTKEGILKQIKMASVKLADVVLRLSTEDCFDLACDLSVRHGRNLKKFGPPCACSFSQCIGCLEKLVSNLSSSDPIPAPPIQPVDREDFIYTIVDLLESEDSAACATWQFGQNDDPKWLEDMADALQNMADTLWEIAKTIDPMELPCVKEAMASLCKLNGIELWYGIVIREVEASNGSADHRKGEKTVDFFPWNISGEFEKMKRDNDKLIMPSRIITDRKGGVEDPFGITLRKALARAVREQGNESYKRGAYKEASNHYTKAMGYDDEEAIYPLNRAACLIKLSRFSEAEADCSKALSLDSNNHKAYFRRGVSRSGLGDLKGAVNDFKQVLQLQKDDEITFLELRKLSTQILLQGSKTMSKGQLSSLQVESLLPQLQSPLNHRDDETENSADSKESEEEEESSCITEINDACLDLSKKDHQSPSVLEVYSQVSFAIAFSGIVKKETGIDIKVPLACSSLPTSV